MIRLTTALFLLIASFASLFTAFYLPTLNITRALFNALPFYAPLAAFFLAASLGLKTSSGQRPWIFTIFLYMAAAIAGEFTLREYLAPIAAARPLANPLPEDFLLTGYPGSKKGVMSAAPQGIYIFGEMIQTPVGYLGRNFSLLSSNSVMESDMVRVEENRIFALNLRTISRGATNTVPGISPLQMPLSIAPLYALWGEKSPQDIPAAAVLGRFEIFKNPLLEPYKKTVVLAFGRYAGTLVLLLIAAAFGFSAANTLDFKKMHLVGTLAALMFGLPAICMVHYYVIEIINAAVNGLL